MRDFIQITKLSNYKFWNRNGLQYTTVRKVTSTFLKFNELFLQKALKYAASLEAKY